MSKHGWKYKKLGEVCETSSGGTPSKNHREYYENGNIPWLRSGEVSQTYIYDTELFITPLGLNNSSAKLFPIDTVVVAMYGATVGQVGILKNAMTTNQAVCGIFPNSYFKPDFLMHFLKCKKSFFLKQAVGGAQSNISQNIIKNLLIPVPGMAEQEAIVAELDEINEAIAALQQQVADLDTLAQATFYDMFGDPVTNPKAWPVKKLGECFQIGSGGTPSKKVSEYWENGDIPWIGSNMCQNCVLYKTDGKFISEEGLNHSSAKMLEIGTVLVALVGATIGKVALLKTKTSTNQNIAFIKVNESNEFLPEFVFYHIMNQYDEFMNIGNGDFKMANQEFIKSLTIIFPPLSLQQEFATKVEAIEAAKTELNAQIAEMQTLLASRMDYYFD